MDLFPQGQLEAGLAQALALRQIATLTHLPTGSQGDEGCHRVKLPGGGSAPTQTGDSSEQVYVVLTGTLTFRWGAQLELSGNAHSGAVVRVAACVQHAITNASDQEPLECLRMPTGH